MTSPLCTHRSRSRPLFAAVAACLLWSSGCDRREPAGAGWTPPSDPADLEPELAARIAEAKRELARGASGVPGESAAAKIGELGILYEANRFDPQARACFARALALDPSDPHWFTHGGRLARQHGDLEAALAILRDGARRHGVFAPMLHELGVTALQAGELDEALDAFRRLAAARPEIAEGHLGIGEALLARGSAAEALPYVEKAVEVEPGYRRIHYVLGLVQRDLGRMEEAERELALGAGASARRMRDRWSDALTSMSHSRTMRNQRALSLLRAGRGEEALALLEETLALDRDDPRTLVQLGLAYRQLGRSEAALGAFRDAIAIAPDAYQARVNLGQTLLESGRATEALEAARGAVAAGPRVPQAQMLLSDTLYALDRDGEAEAALELALDCAPSDASMRFHAAQQLASRGRNERALFHLNELARLAPSDPAPWVAMAELYAVLGREDDGRRCREQAESLASAQSRAAPEGAAAAAGTDDARKP